MRESLTEAHCNAWDCWDWDQLRIVEVKGTAKLLQPDDVEVPILGRFADYLSLLPGILTDPGEDDTLFIAYLPFSMVESLADCPTVQYSKL